MQQHHRPAAGRQEQVGRQPRALPAPLQGAGARGGASAPSTAAASATSTAARRSHIPKKDLTEPVFHHGQGGIREMVHPGNKDFVRGDRIERPKGGGGRRQRQGRGQRLRRGRGRLRLPAEQGRVHAGLLRGPGAAQPGAHAAGRDARMEEPARRLQQRRHARPTCTWCARCAAPSAGASPSAPARAPKLRELEEELDALLRRADEPLALDARSRRCEAEIAALRARIARIPFLDPIDLRYRNRVRVPVPTSKAVMFCLMDVSGSMDEARKDLRQALLHPAVPVPDAPLREDRPRLHPPPHAGAGGRRGGLLPRPRDRRHGGVAARWC